MADENKQQEGIGGWDPDSPDNPVLTPRGLRRLLGVGPKWEIRHRAENRIIGQTRAGKQYRYMRAEVVQALIAGQVLLPKKKPAPLGLARSRRLKRAMA